MNVVGNDMKHLIHQIGKRAWRTIAAVALVTLSSGGNEASAICSDQLAPMVERFDSCGAASCVSVANDFFQALQEAGVTHRQLYYPADCQAEEMRAQVWYWAARLHQLCGRDTVAEGYASKAIPHFDYCGNDTMFILASVTRSFSLSQMGQTAEAEALAAAALERSDNIHRNDFVALALAAKVEAMACDANAGKAAAYVKYIAHGDTLLVPDDWRSKVYAVIGSVCLGLCQYERAAHYALLSIEAESARGFECLMVRQAGSTSRALIEAGLTQEAEDFLVRAMESLRARGASLALGHACNMLADIYLSRSEVDAAVKLYAEAIGECRRHGDIPMVCHASLGLSRALMHTDPDAAESYQEQYEETLSELDSAALASAYLHLVPEVPHSANEHGALWWCACIGGALVVLFLLLWIFARKQLYVVRHCSLWMIVTQLVRGRNAVYARLTESDHEFLSRLSEAVRAQMESGLFDERALAHGMGITTTSMRRKVRAVTGESSTAYIRMLRVQQARKILDNTPNCVPFDVAVRCGYQDISNFEADFKKVCGISLEQYMIARRNSY